MQSLDLHSVLSFLQAESQTWKVGLVVGKQCLFYAGYNNSKNNSQFSTQRDQSGSLVVSDKDEDGTFCCERILLESCPML